MSYTKEEDGYYDEYGNWLSKTLIENPDEYNIHCNLEE